MARWKLREAHYIHGVRDGSRAEWVYKEINRANGREIQKKFPVPMHLDPKIEIDWTHRDSPYDDGYIVVALEGSTDTHDIIIDRKSVTPGMEPMDDEAKQISAELAKSYQPVEGREDATYSERLLDKFIEQLAEAHSTAATANTGNVQGLGDVLKAMTEMMAQNQQILMALVAQNKPQVGARR
jgi:hypothetical protein